MTPGISVIIAHHNAPDKLRVCLESLVHSSYRPFEIIVVDDGSDHDPRELVTGFDVKWIVLASSHGSGYARHKGAESSVYDILFFIDADTVMPPDALHRVARAIHDEQHDGVIGVVDPVPVNRGFVAEWVASETNFLGLRSPETPHQCFIALCGALRTDAYFHHGGLHHRDIDDFELSSRLAGSALRIKTDKGLNFKHHYSPLAGSLRKLFTRSFFYVQLEPRPSSPWFSTDRKLATGLALLAALTAPLALASSWAAIPIVAALGFLFFSRALLAHHYRTHGLVFLLKSIGVKFALSLAVALGGIAGTACRWFEAWKFAFIAATGPARIYFRINSPTYAILYVTAKCNSRCSYCFQWEILNEPSRLKRELTVAEYVRLAKSMGPMEHITLGGGEPFLRKGLADIAEAFYKYTGVRNISIPSNGTRPDLIESVGGEILRRCPKATVKMSLSIDGIGHEHDHLRGAIGNYEKLIESDQVLRRLRTQHSNLYYLVNTCYNGRNQDTVIKTIQENRRRFDHDIQVSTFVRGSLADSHEKDVDINTYYDLVEYLEHIQTIERKRNTYFLDSMHQALQIESRANITKVLTRGESDYTCTAGTNMVVIDDVGNVNPCEILPGKFSYGNLREFGMSLPAMMEQARVRETQRRIRDEKCFCTWECAQVNSIVYSPHGYKQMLKHMWALSGRRRVLAKVKAQRNASDQSVMDFDVFRRSLRREAVPNQQEPVHHMVSEGSSLNPFNIESCADEAGVVQVTIAMNEEELRRKRERWLRPVVLSRNEAEEREPVDR
jgi:radical SAM protein with 4Fe4S-binding SPASM domain